MLMNRNSDEYKYIECKSTLELVLKQLEILYNYGSFTGSLKPFIFNLIKEGNKTLKKIKE